MTDDPTSMVPQDVAEQVVAAYEAGEKLRKIEAQFELTRSQVYWVISKSKAAPKRSKLKSRLDDGDERTIARLYEVVEAQDARIQQLEAFIVHHGWSVPDHDWVDPNV